MADISKITLPKNGGTYSFKDTVARDKLDALPANVGDVTAVDPGTTTDPVSLYYTKAEVNELIPDVSNYQTADQVNSAINTKAASYYTKTEVDGKIPDTSSFQTASQVNSAIDTKLNSKITISADDPTGGSDGDLWFKYEA